LKAGGKLEFGRNKDSGHDSEGHELFRGVLESLAHGDRKGRGNEEVKRYMLPMLKGVGTGHTFTLNCRSIT